MSYDDLRNRRTYNLSGVDVSTGSVVGSFNGPAGLSGRVRAVEYTVVTAVTGGPATVSIGNPGATAPVDVSIPNGAVDSAGSATADEIRAAGADVEDGAIGPQLQADTVVDVTAAGVGAGAVDLVVTVDWF